MQLLKIGDGTHRLSNSQKGLQLSNSQKRRKAWKKICIYIDNVVNMWNILNIFGSVVIFIKQNCGVSFPFEVRLAKSLKSSLWLNACFSVWEDKKHFVKRNPNDPFFLWKYFMEPKSSFDALNHNLKQALSMTQVSLLEFWLWELRPNISPFIYSYNSFHKRYLFKIKSHEGTLYWSFTKNKNDFLKKVLV